MRSEDIGAELTKKPYQPPKNANELIRRYKDGERYFRHADLRSANLTKAILSGANLSGADLTKANLSGADLRGMRLMATNFEGAVLTGADLSGSDMRHALLPGATLQGTRLHSTNLERAYLRDSNLSDANLTGAYLTGATLIGTNLDRAVFAHTVIDRLDLCEARGLGSAICSGSSMIGVSALIGTASGIAIDRTRQDDVEAFLRRAGLDERYFQLFRSTYARPIEFYSCFISYSHTDTFFAQRLHDHLQARGIRCWLDEKQLLPGDLFLDEIDRGIRLWDKVLLCCSRSSLEKSWWVDKEIDKAVRKEEQLFRERGKRVLALIPLNLDGYLLHGWESPKTSLITDRLAADFTGWEKDNAKFDAEFDKVVRALRADPGAREKPPVPKL